VVERNRREWDVLATRMDVERLVKISRVNKLAGRSPGRPKRRCSDLIPDEIGSFAYNKEEEKEEDGEFSQA
jgi:hypothetical protein